MAAGRRKLDNGGGGGGARCPIEYTSLIDWLLICL
jgi:hypothetical protein